MADSVPELRLRDLVGRVGDNRLVVAGGRLRDRVLSSRLFVRSTFVSDDRLYVRRLPIPATGRGNVCAKPVVTDSLVGVNNDVVALTDVDIDRIGGVRLDGNEVGGDDREIVIINRHMEVVVDAGVDQTQTMLLSLLDGCDMMLAAELSLHRAVNETMVGNRRSSGTVQSADVQCEDRLVEPIGQGQRS